MKKEYIIPETGIHRVSLQQMIASTTTTPGSAVTETNSSTLSVSFDNVIEGGDASVAAARGGTWDE